MSEFESFTVEELLREIQREEEALATKRVDLSLAEKRRADIEVAIAEERSLAREERVRLRQARIERYETAMRELERQQTRFEERIRKRVEEISNLESAIATNEERLRLPFLSPTERYITRETIARLARTLAALRGWLTRDTRYLNFIRETLTHNRRVLSALRAWQTREEPLLRRLAELESALADVTTTIQQLKTQISQELTRLEQKRKLLPKLYRIKIRLYNEERKPTPTGMFQCFMDVDALINPSTGLVDWSWHLTRDEIEICKFHMVGYFKGLAKWRSPEQMVLAYFDQPEGIPYADSVARYKRKITGEPYAKNVPDEFIAKAEGLTVNQLIVGISSVEPKPNLDPKAEKMGVFFERAMIINADGVVKWDEIRDRWVWHPSEERVKEIRKELKFE